MNREISVKNILMKSWKYCMAGAVMLAVVKRITFSIDEIRLLTIKVIIGAFVYFLILLILREEIMLNEWRKLTDYVKERRG